MSKPQRGRLFYGQCGRINDAGRPCPGRIIQTSAARFACELCGDEADLTTVGEWQRSQAAREAIDSTRGH